jgi:glutaredoxin 2
MQLSEKEKNEIRNFQSNYRSTTTKLLNINSDLERLKKELNKPTCETVESIKVEVDRLNDEVILLSKSLVAQTISFNDYIESIKVKYNRFEIDLSFLIQ